MDEVLSINTSANVFVFGDFNVCHKDWFFYPSAVVSQFDPEKNVIKLKFGRNIQKYV